MKAEYKKQSGEMKETLDKQMDDLRAFQKQSWNSGNSYKKK